MPLAPRKVVTWDKVQRLVRNTEIWQKKESIVHRLPQHYTKRYWANLEHDRRPVHYVPPTTRYEWDPFKNMRVENENYPIFPLHPPEADKGLWAGEGVVKGFWHEPQDKKHRFKARRWLPFYIYPQLFRRTYYSEILDRWMLIWTTRTAHRLVDENQGLDYYLLRTPELDLDSKLASKLKRELFMSLARGADFIKDDNRKTYILEKYAEFILPEEEAEWIALDLNEACQKLQDIEDEKAGDLVPWKVRYEKELLEKLKVDSGDSSTRAKGQLESDGVVKRLASKVWNTLSVRKN